MTTRYVHQPTTDRLLGWFIARSAGWSVRADSDCPGVSPLCEARSFEIGVLPMIAFTVSGSRSA